MDLWLSESESGVGEDMIGFFFFFPEGEKCFKIVMMVV